MASTSNRSICFTCNKEKLTYPCQGCSNRFCFDHLGQHRTDLSRQLEHIQNDHDQLRQNINEQKRDPTQHILIKQIDRWEKESIDQIKQTAQQCREKWIDYSSGYLLQIEKKLKDLAEHIKKIQREEEVNEIDLNDLKQRLGNLQKELDQPTNISFEQQTTSFINKISLQTLSVKKGKNKNVLIERGKFHSLCAFSSLLFIESELMINQYLNIEHFVFLHW